MPTTRSARRPDASATPADRRTRLRLRDLCDEVLASFRAATERDPLSASDRREARALLERLTPSLHG